ncbi:MAG TPA: hypothetical protein PLO78_05270 [Candidatus Omnitrophota bacterium]|nr:hypothetical protein [Candidatus Omnitrophota bacterium]
MNTVKGYNKIQTSNKIFGLEFFDLLVLLVIYMVIFVLSNNLILNLAIVTASYLGLRFYKRGKAPHWSGSVLRFLMHPREYPLKRERKEDQFLK